MACMREALNIGILRGWLGAQRDYILYNVHVTTIERTLECITCYSMLLKKLLIKKTNYIL